MVSFAIESKMEKNRLDVEWMVASLAFPFLLKLSRRARVLVVHSFQSVRACFNSRANEDVVQLL